MRIFTLGHSNQSIESFLDLLARNGVLRIADVRRYPSSRRWPQFNGGTLERSLKDRGIEYRHFESLGGKRDPSPDAARHLGLESPWQRDYAAYMNTPTYAGALDDLGTWAADKPTAIMCAEAAPDHCHRNLLSDAMTQRGHEVVHALATGSRKHRAHPALRVDEGALVYDQGVLPLGF